MPLTSNVALHPRWCSPQLCEATGGDVVHAEVGGVVPVESTTDVLGVALVGYDELTRHGEQVSHEPQVKLSHGGRRLVLTLAESEALEALLHDTNARAHT